MGSEHPRSARSSIPEPHRQSIAAAVALLSHTQAGFATPRMEMEDSQRVDWLGPVATSEGVRATVIGFKVYID